MKRLLTALLVLMLCLSLPVGAASAKVQAVEVVKDDGTVTVVTKQPTTFWESPQLKPGETVLSPGMLTVTNKTDTARDILLDNVLLPYNTPAALEYLNHLTLTVGVLSADEESQILYRGPYSRINDDNHASKIQAFLEPDETAVFVIWLSCDYTYAGDTYSGNSVLEWQFTTPLTEEEQAVQAEETVDDPILHQWLIGGGIAVLLIGMSLLISKKSQA